MVMQKKKKEDTYSVAKVKETKIDQDILNYDYQTRYAKLIVSWIKEG
jgi:translation initiation factor IF-3